MTSSLHGKVALVTGASGDIGRAIALALAAEGTRMCLVGRDQQRLRECAKAAMRAGVGAPIVMTEDLDDDRARQRLAGATRELKTLDILVHAAGRYERGPTATAPLDGLDRQYKSNVRAPYHLTQLLLPQLCESGGDIVFVNSTQGLAASAEIGQFAVTQHALRAFADSLREEVNSSGVRVLTLYLGRAASRRQARIFADEGRSYEPERLLQPEDAASMLVAALRLPRTAEVTSLTLRPAQKSY
jgi:NADP-dependent 3-hydroxy acid dehydrogenase YdfG